MKALLWLPPEQVACTGVYVLPYHSGDCQQKWGNLLVLLQRSPGTNGFERKRLSMFFSSIAQLKTTSEAAQLTKLRVS